MLTNVLMNGMIRVESEDAFLLLLLLLPRRAVLSWTH